MEYNEVTFSCLQNFGRQFPQLLSAEYGMYPMIGESYCINIYFDQTLYVQIKFWSGVSQVSQAGASHFCLSLMFWSHPYLITSLLLCFPAGTETTAFFHFHIVCMCLWQTIIPRNVANEQKDMRSFHISSYI